MTTFRLTSQSLNALKPLPNRRICKLSVCGTEFDLPFNTLPFISPQLFTHFSEEDTPFWVNCPTGSPDISEERLIRCCQQLTSHLSDSEPMSLAADDAASMKHLLAKIGSYQLIRDFEANKITFHPFSLSDTSETFRFKVCGETFECGFLSASLLSAKASEIISEETVFELTIECPASFNSESFLRTFGHVFSTISGFPLEITKENVLTVFSISTALNNSELSAAAVGFIESKEEMNNGNQCLQFLISLPNDYSAFAPFSIETVSSQLSSFETSSLLQLSPPIVSKILEDSHLTVKSQEWLFSFLEEYCQNWGDASYELFQSVQFSKLKGSLVKRFFANFPIRLASNDLFSHLRKL
jgi:hypothetical protein